MRRITPLQFACGERDIHRGGVLGNGKHDGSRCEDGEKGSFLIRNPAEEIDYFHHFLPVMLIVHFCSIVQDFKRKSIIFVSTYTNTSL